MDILKRTTKFGSGETTITEAPAVTCPACEETVFTEKVGDVSCDTCDHEFNAQDHYVTSCSTVACDECGENITFIQENRTPIGTWESYYCYKCREILAIETEDGPQSLENMIMTDWVTNGQPINQIATEFGDRYWITETETDREEFATHLLNSEATTADSRFNPYRPGNTAAYLCFTDDYCVGYITWNWDNADPELGQLYILPAFRQQGIGSEFVKAWRDDLIGADSKFRVNNPNENMFQLLRSIGAIELTDEDIEFPGCDIVGNGFHLPPEWVGQ